MNQISALEARCCYQNSRLDALSSRMRLAELVGLEIGACNKPTVPPSVGDCRYADFRSAQEMSDLWSIPRSSICEVDYILKRSLRLSEQINQRFDYIVACHVLEHIPDPIGYLIDASKILNEGGNIFMMVPDKNKTFDLHRPNTTIDHLLMDYHDGSRYPSLEHIMEFHRYALSYENKNEVSVADAYKYAVQYHDQGEADAHCHVWDDESFQKQFMYLSDHSLLADLVLTDFLPTPPGLNEFTAVFRRAQRSTMSKFSTFNSRDRRVF